MRIQSVQLPKIFNTTPQNQELKLKQEHKNNTNSMSDPIISSNISFEARVDKGLERFYNVNSEKMPKTVKTFIENLDDKKAFTPLRAQAAAFAALVGIGSVAEIKENFPEEELFANLIDVDSSHATRGVLGVYRENKELLKMFNQNILASGENFTVWLVKKVFLEGKTIEDINKDFKASVDADFKKLYEAKNDSEQPIRFSTLKSLGIQTPAFEYQQSLRYTRDGYSDLVGEQISQAQRAFWDSMPPEERTQRARKTVENFEKWWSNLTTDNKLEMIAEQTTELEMLDLYKDSNFNKSSKKGIKTSQNPIEKEQNAEHKIAPQEKVSSNLSKDDLFKIWAGNNLKLYTSNLTEYEKRLLEEKREQKRADFWKTMSPEERADYILKLQTGGQILSFAMTDAWNANPEIIIALSKHLKEKHINRPVDLVYGSEGYNEFLSKIMIEFWRNNPEIADKFGDSITLSHKKVKEAVKNGTFEILKKEINKAKILRQQKINEIIKNYIPVDVEKFKKDKSEQVKNFIDAYFEVNPKTMPQGMPVQYFNDFWEVLEKEFLPQEIESMTKYLRHMPMNPIELIETQRLLNSETKSLARVNRALEMSICDALYNCTHNPKVYEMTPTDSKFAIDQIIAGNKIIEFDSQYSNKYYSIPVINNNINNKEINKSYQKFLQAADNINAVDIIDSHFIVNPKIHDADLRERILNSLLTHVKHQGVVSKILFTSEFNYPVAIRAALMRKFVSYLPNVITPDNLIIRTIEPEDFERENRLYEIGKKHSEKYSFMPKNALEAYNREAYKILRNYDDKYLNLYEERALGIGKKGINVIQPIPIVGVAKTNPFNVLEFLATEQAFADILYKATDDARVYSLRLEEFMFLFEKLKYTNLKKDDEIKVPSRVLDKEISIKLKHRINFADKNTLYKDYLEELSDIAKTKFSNDETIPVQELLYILNPDEEKTEVDKYTQLRLEKIVDNTHISAQ